MISQYIFLLYVALLGFFFMLLFKNRVTFINRCFLSFPMGITIWVFMGFVLFMLDIPLSRPLIYSLGFTIAGVFSLIHFRNKNLSIRDAIPTAAFFIFFSIFAFIFLKFNFSFFSNDSWTLYLGGQYLAKYHNLTDNLVNLNGIFSYILHTSAYIFKFEYLYALYPLLTLFFYVLFIYNLYSPFKEKSFRFDQESIFCILSALFLLSTYFILFNASYIHANLLFGVYSFIALIGIWRRITVGEKGWLVISAIALFSCCFIRLEGPLFSLIIIVILISLEEVKFKEKLGYLGFICFMVIIWHIKMYFLLLGYQSKFLNSGRILLIISSYAVIFLGFLLSRGGFLYKLKEFLPVIMLYFLTILWTILIFKQGLRVKGGVLILKRFGLFLINTLRDGGWGVGWIALVLMFVIVLFLSRFKFEKVFLYYFFSFFLLLNSISLIRGGWRGGWGDSSNRMLIHLVFLIAFYIFLKFKLLFFSEKVEKNRYAKQ